MEKIRHAAYEEEAYQTHDVRLVAFQAVDDMLVRAAANTPHSTDLSDNHRGARKSDADSIWALPGRWGKKPQTTLST